MLVNRVNLAWKDDNIMGVLLVDINGAFPRLVKGRLIRVMIPKKREGDLIRCDRCSFLDTPVQMVIKDNVLQNHLVEAGIPQCLLILQSISNGRTGDIFRLTLEDINSTPYMEERPPERPPVNTHGSNRSGK